MGPTQRGGAGTWPPTDQHPDARSERLPKCVYFASDIHLGGGSSAADARRREQCFVAWLDCVAADAEAIVLLGDIFDFWFEYRRVVPKGFTRTLGKLSELTDRGIRICFFAGNHDQWIGDYLRTECGLELYTDPQCLTFNDVHLFLAHGHHMGVGREPRLLNRIFRSRLLRWLFRTFVPHNLAMRFGLWWSRKSRLAHDRRGPADPAVTDPLIGFARSYAAAHPQQPVDHFLFGHMHVARDFRDGALHTLHLGAWTASRGSYARLDASGALTLETFDFDL